MSDDARWLRAAVERGWIRQEEAESGRPARELLTPDQIRELEAGRDLAARLLEAGLLKGADLVDRAPARFGRYAILRELGQGGGGRVYLARDPELGREVAVKILDRGVAANPERFRREMEILAALRHPNIVTIFDAGTEEGRPWYAMEYAGGRSLAEATLPLREAVRVLERVARACHAAHEKGIVHRDLKPANILLADRPVVADFGIAKLPDADLTETGQTLGTPHYMSPEQAEGREIDRRSDVYSLGVVLYELLTRRRPFQGSGALEIARKVSREEPPPPRALDPQVPRDLEIVTLRAMAKRAADRYPTADAFADDLAAWMDGRPVAARPPGLRERLVSAVRRRPRRFAAALGALALVLLLLAARGGKGTAPRPRLEQAHQVVLEEALAIQGWQVNLYKPAQEISYAALEASLGRLRPVLEWPDLTPGLRRQGHAAAARAYLFMGRTGEALAELDRAIDAGRGQRNGEDYLERARLRWEDLLRDALAKNEAEAEALLKLVRADLQAALAAGFQDPWLQDLAAALLRLAEKKEQGVEGTFREFDRLAAVAGKPAEEVAKLRGDLLLLLKRNEEAVAEYRRAVAIREGYVQAYNALALALALRKGGENRKDVLEAFEVASRAIDLNPRYEASYFLFAWLCRGTLRASPEELCRFDPESLALVESAVAKLRTGSAVRPDSHALRVAYGTASLLRGFLLTGAGKDPTPAVEEAVKVLAAAVEREGGRYDPWLALGAARTFLFSRDRARRADLAAAEQALERAAERAPLNPAVRRWAGYRHFLAERYRDAAREWKRAVELDPGMADDLRAEIAEAEARK